MVLFFTNLHDPNPRDPIRTAPSMHNTFLQVKYCHAGAHFWSGNSASAGHTVSAGRLEIAVPTKAVTTRAAKTIRRAGF